jgi:hypothetical protein
MELLLLREAGHAVVPCSATPTFSTPVQPRGGHLRLGVSSPDIYVVIVPVCASLSHLPNARTKRSVCFFPPLYGGSGRVFHKAGASACKTRLLFLLGPLYLLILVERASVVYRINLQQNH